jgi:hypothetical protein
MTQKSSSNVWSEKEGAYVEHEDLSSVVLRDQEAVDLDVIKQELHERSQQAGHIEVLGPLATVTKRTNWNENGISLERRRARNELSQADVEESLVRATRSYVPTSLGAQVRCIDGRTIKGYADQAAKWFARKLGPQIPGGTVVDAIASSIASEDVASADLRASIATASDTDQTLGFLPGDHVDDHREAGRTGCRAVDGAEIHCGHINLATIPEIEAAMRMLLGDAFNDDHFEVVVTSTKKVLTEKPDFFIPKDEIISELLTHNSAAAPILTGTHNEIIVLINTVKNETFHGDHFAAQTDGNIQAFNYDVWHTFDVATVQFSEDNELQSKFVHARVALALSELMDLTDGSLLLAVRRPDSVARFAA